LPQKKKIKLLGMKDVPWKYEQERGPRGLNGTEPQREGGVVDGRKKGMGGGGGGLLH